MAANMAIDMLSKIYLRETISDALRDSKLKT